MEENGYITQAEATRASQRGLGLKRGTRYIQRREPYFFDYVQEKLIERYGVGVVRRGGLRIHTTIDPKMQEDARNADERVLRGSEPARAPRSSRSTRPTEISARWPRAAPTREQLQPRRAGPPPAGLGVQDLRAYGGDPKGIDPDTTYYTSKPLDIDDPTYGTGRSRPSGTATSGPSALRARRCRSDNTVYAQLILDIGPKAVCETAKLLGITTQLDCYPAEGLGGLTPV